MARRPLWSFSIIVSNRAEFLLGGEGEGGDLSLAPLYEAMVCVHKLSYLT